MSAITSPVALRLQPAGPSGRRWWLNISTAAALAWVPGMAASAGAAPESPQVQAAPVPCTRLVVAFLDSPPEMVVYSKHRHSGVLQYIVEEAARRIRCNIEWREMPFGASLDALKKWDVDIVTNVRFRTPERERFARFSYNLGNINSAIYFLQNINDPRDIKSLKELAEHRIGYRRGVYYFKEFERMTRIPFDDNDTMARDFAEEKIDVMVVNNKISSERALKSAGVNASRYRYASLVMNKELMGMYLMYSLAPQHQPVFDRLDQELKKMVQEGVVNEIYQSFDAQAPKPLQEGKPDGRP